jgi:hypothetical protein
MPGGSQLEVAFPTNNDPGTGFPAQRSGTVWRRVITLPIAGTYPYEFRSVAQTVFFRTAYNSPCSGCASYERPYESVTTTQPNSDVLFEFDEAYGLMRAVVLGPTATGNSSWGRIKTSYR